MFNHQTYENFDFSYSLMSDKYSRQLFAELILMQALGEDKFRLSIFDNKFVKSYEKSSSEIINSQSSIKAYSWILKKIYIKQYDFSIYTTPVFLNLLNLNRVYRYQNKKNIIDISKGDVVIDGGVGWGDTSIYFQKKTGPSGIIHSFDVLKEGFNLLDKQININANISNIKKNLYALSDNSGKNVFITDPSPGSTISISKTKIKVKTISIDDYFKINNLKKIDFIKLDIEGAEVDCINGAKNIISRFKPKLAISVYHKWNDLEIIPKMIYEINKDYNFYLDCTTGFGGEAILYCN